MNSWATRTWGHTRRPSKRGTAGAEGGACRHRDRTAESRSIHRRRTGARRGRQPFAIATRGENRIKSEKNPRLETKQACMQKLTREHKRSRPLAVLASLDACKHPVIENSDMHMFLAREHRTLGPNRRSPQPSRG